MFQNFFGDDEHTAADGPYTRVMKTRKWLYFTAVLATSYNMMLINPAKIEEVIGFLALPDQVLRWSLLSALLYLLLIYMALSTQLASIYDLVLSERLRFRKDDEIAAAQIRVDESRKEVIRMDEEQKRHRNTSVAFMSGDKHYSSDEHDVAISIYNRNVETLARILSGDPSDRAFFREIEIAVDVVRVVGPVIMASIAAYFLVF